MIAPPPYESALTALRAKAEQLSQALSHEPHHAGSDNMSNLLHELSVHQIELEMQHDELLKANHELSEARVLAEQSRDQFSLLFNLAPVSFVVLDKRGIIRQCNQAFETLTGMDAAKLFGKTLAEFIDQRDRLAFDIQIKHLAQSPQSAPLEIRISRLARSEAWISFSAVLVSNLPLENGEQASLLAELTDIDQLKKSQQRLDELRLTAEKANQAKSQFLSNMSHELRTPLNAILGFAQLIEMDAQQPGSEELLDCVREILKAGDHLLLLVEDVLDLSRVETGHLHIQPGEVNLEELLNDAIALVRGMARSQGVVIKVDQRAKNAVVKADVSRLRQAVLNLLSNGVKYNRPGGSLNIWSEHAEGWVSLFVQDDGEGIPQEKFAELFKPFSRLGKEYTTTPGTGVGLSLSKQLVEQMGGELGVVSQTGQGATFWIKLPMLQPCFSAPQEDRPSLAIAGLCARILYIEDDERSVRILKSYFSKKAQGLDLLVAETALAGISIAIQQRPDLILCDINLPDKQGYEVVRLLKNTPATQAIPIVALTANAMRHDIEIGEQSGFDAYLTKPVKWGEFDQTILRFVGAEKYKP